MFRIIQLPAVLAALGILMAFPGAAEDTRAAGKSERVQVVFSKGTGGRLDVGFNAQGRELRLQLVPNPRLQRWAAGSRWHQYQGALQGVPDSWARLAVAGESIAVRSSTVASCCWSSPARAPRRKYFAWRTRTSAVTSAWPAIRWRSRRSSRPRWDRSRQRASRD
jgi:hypothetical protein